MDVLNQEEMDHSMEASTNSSHNIAEPPSHLFGDFIEMAYLGIVASLGLLINGYVLRKLVQEREESKRNNKEMNSFLLLKMNLNISDILILGINASGKLGWLITYEWLGGELICRIFNFSSMFSLYLSSNIIVCIAIDRLITVMNAKRLNVARIKNNLVQLLLTAAWTLAVIFSAPQLFVWKTYNVYKDNSSDGWWTQCTDIWSIDRHETYLKGDSNKSPSEIPILISELYRNIHELSHLFLVFFGPSMILIICYFIISIRLIQYASTNPCTMPFSSRVISKNEVCSNILQIDSSESEPCSSSSKSSSFEKKEIHLPKTYKDCKREEKIRIFKNSRQADVLNPTTSLPLKRYATINLVPVWRRHLRSKAFQTTLLVIITHVILWSPYNFYALSRYVSPALYERMNEKANFLKDLQFLISIINPFLYGFSTKKSST